MVTLLGALEHEVSVTVADRSKACTIFYRSDTGILGSNPIFITVKLSLCLTNEALRHEGVWGVDVWIHIFLIGHLLEMSSASRPEHFTSGERASGTHWIGG
jgi:hypothetical protein